MVSTILAPTSQALINGILTSFVINVFQRVFITSIPRLIFFVYTTILGETSTATAKPEISADFPIRSSQLLINSPQPTISCSNRQVFGPTHAPNTQRHHNKFTNHKRGTIRISINYLFLFKLFVSLSHIIRIFFKKSAYKKHLQSHSEVFSIFHQNLSMLAFTYLTILF